MAELVKLTDLQALLSPAGDDVMLITDISEPSETDRSKKVTVNILNQAMSLIGEIQTSSNRTLELADAGKIIALTGTNTRTFTIPNNSTVAFPVGTTISLVKDGTGNLVIEAAEGVTIKSETGLIITGQYGLATLIKVDTNVWRAGGSLSAA